MIVSELIEKLKALPQDLKVLTTWEGEIVEFNDDSPRQHEVHKTEFGFYNHWGLTSCCWYCAEEQLPITKCVMID